MAWTNEQRLEFAVKFTFDNLDFYRDGDWLNLTEDIKSFLGVFEQGEMLGDILTLGSFIPIKNPQPSRDELCKLQAEMRAVLAFPTGAPARVEITLDYTIVPVRVPHLQPYIQRSGTFRDCALGLLIRLLEVESTASVVCCPQCKTIFYRRGKQVFCSRTCTNRAMIQRKRKRDRDKEARKKHGGKERKAR